MIHRILEEIMSQSDRIALAFDGRVAPDEMFDQDYMIGLEDLGPTMGADPSSWTGEIPSAFWEE